MHRCSPDDFVKNMTKVIVALIQIKTHMHSYVTMHVHIFGRGQVLIESLNQENQQDLIGKSIN